MKEELIPQEARDRLRACVEKEDTDKFVTCRVASDLWAEFKYGIIDKKMKQEGWTPKEAPGRAHKWFLSSLAADAGLGYQSMLHRQKVGDNIIARGYLGGPNENVSYQKWVCLLVNADKDEDGLVQKEIIDERLEWYHKVADDNFGNPPSVLDIKKQYSKRGKDPEWKLAARKLYNISKKMNNIKDVPQNWMNLIGPILKEGKEEGWN